MVILSEVAQKLEKILNGVDTEVTDSNPIAHRYKVEAQGFHIDHILDKDTGTNFIPVFVSSMGGQFNPVAGLKQGTYTIPISFYFPVRFKDDFFKLCHTAHEREYFFPKLSLDIFRRCVGVFNYVMQKSGGNRGVVHS